ncbi:GHKL domain-containing protein [Butyribacter intestini]|uniref:GHKL domain-containing protein n=1 Tax=Butyribacter intestini TaxID=1703332 RepID=UPI0009EC8931|nr:GHKL domain-containing protein [Butyribacter intestini]
MKNSYNGELNYKNGRIITKKQDKGMRGIGLRSVKATVEKHTGTVDIEHNDTDFFVKIMMYL